MHVIWFFPSPLHGSVSVLQHILKSDMKYHIWWKQSDSFHIRIGFAVLSPICSKRYWKFQSNWGIKHITYMIFILGFLSCFIDSPEILKHKRNRRLQYNICVTQEMVLRMEFVICEAFAIKIPSTYAPSSHHTYHWFICIFHRAKYSIYLDDGTICCRHHISQLYLLSIHAHIVYRISVAANFVIL